MERKIPDHKIAAISRRIEAGKLSLRAIAKYEGVSYYTVWHISKGSYDGGGKFPNLASKFNKRFAVEAIKHF